MYDKITFYNPALPQIRATTDVAGTKTTNDRKNDRRD